ncbi:MAG: hypothetical protein ABIZ80_03400 [Bryobacteraceae bacterium]
MWLLSFAGKTAYVKHCAGLNYISELLRCPRTLIEAATLVSADREQRESVQVDPAQDIKKGAAMPGLEVSDYQAIRAVRKDLKLRKRELAECGIGKEKRKAELQSGIQRSEAYLKEAQAPGGRIRRTGGMVDRLRSRVRKAYERALSEIGKNHVPLANHLHASIRTGSSLIYVPVEMPDWEF